MPDPYYVLNARSLLRAALLEPDVVGAAYMAREAYRIGVDYELFPPGGGEWAFIGCEPGFFHDSDLLTEAMQWHSVDRAVFYVARQLDTLVPRLPANDLLHRLQGYLKARF